MHPKLLIKREQTPKIYCIYSRKPSNTDFHFHSHIEMYLVEHGEVDVWVGSRYKRLRSGEMAVMLSYDAHRYKVIGDATISCLIVPPSMCGELNGKVIKRPFINDVYLFENMLKCCQMIHQNKNSLLTNGCISVVCGLLLDGLDFSERESTADTDGMSQVLLYLHDNFKNDITLTSTAAALGFNQSYLSRQFKEVIGIGFNNYVTMLRLRHAVILLQKGKQISTSAYDSGFNSMRTFYRAFHNEFGCTPKEYDELKR